MPTSTDTFQRVDPVTNKVTNEVEGRFKAQGIDFTVDAPAGTLTDTQIRWKRQNGAWVAFIEAGRSTLPGGEETSSMRIAAKTSESQADETRLELSRTVWPDATARGSIQAIASGMPQTAVRKILDNFGDSDFSLDIATSAAVATSFGQIPGPWPVSVNIPLTGGTYLVGVFATAMKQGAGGMLFLDVTWNGVNKGALQQWNSTINEHTTLNPIFFALPNLGSGTYTLAVAHGGGAGVTWSNADSRLTYFIVGNF